MIDEKRIAEIDAKIEGHETARALRKTANLRSISAPRRAFLREAADLIESLQAQLDAAIAGQETLQRALEASWRNGDAAVAALAESRRREQAAINLIEDVSDALSWPKPVTAQALICKWCASQEASRRTGTDPDRAAEGITVQCLQD